MRWNTTECVTVNDKGKVYRKWSFIISPKKYRTLTWLWYSTLKSNTRKCVYIYIYIIQYNAKLACGTQWNKSWGCSKYKWTNTKKGSFRVTKHNGENTVFSPGTYQILAAKCSMDVLGYKAEVEICTYSVCTTARGRKMDMSTSAFDNSNQTVAWEPCFQYIAG